MFNESWLIIAAADNLDVDLIRSHALHSRILVCDGAYNSLFSCDISIDVLLGDFDSIDPNKLDAARKKNCVVVDASNQNKTDLQKAIEYIDTFSPKKIVVVNMLGGRMDQTLFNFYLLRQHYSTERLLVFLNTSTKALFFRDVSLSIAGGKGKLVSILGFPHACITTQGLNYDVIDFVVGFDANESVSNSMLKSTAGMTITGDAVLIIDSGLKITLS